ncbi:hypothetical protein [Terrihabitans sp. B22-R8]|uniref:hypothetical protein n=1 Tax=Terrihabitans sp. B22-R8 TaxID=3425128 RepID=UPI00403C2A45
MNDNDHLRADQDPKESYGEKKREEKKLEKSVEDTFPASDPPAETQPGSGITESEVIDETKIRR